MSGLHSSKEVSSLPEDVEQKMSVIQETIASLARRKLDLENAVVAKNSELDQVTVRLEHTNAESQRITALYEEKMSTLNERENKLSQKESALEVYANALQEKEKKINKYILIFENMKDVIS